MEEAHHTCMSYYSLNETQSVDCCHKEMDNFGKTNMMTVIFAPGHPNPSYRTFKTGSLLSKNDLYPSGLVIVDEKLNTKRWN